MRMTIRQARAAVRAAAIGRHYAGDCVERGNTLMNNKAGDRPKKGRRA